MRGGRRRGREARRGSRAGRSRPMASVPAELEDAVASRLSRSRRRGGRFAPRAATGPRRRARDRKRGKASARLAKPVNPKRAVRRDGVDAARTLLSCTNARHLVPTADVAALRSMQKSADRRPADSRRLLLRESGSERAARTTCRISSSWDSADYVSRDSWIRLTERKRRGDGRRLLATRPKRRRHPWRLPLTLVKRRLGQHRLGQRVQLLGGWHLRDQPDRDADRDAAVDTRAPLPRNWVGLQEKLLRNLSWALWLLVSDLSAIPISSTIPWRTLSTPVDGPWVARYQ